MPSADCGPESHHIQASTGASPLFCGRVKPKRPLMPRGTSVQATWLTDHPLSAHCTEVEIGLAL
jgi:hypothetical protein